MKKLCVIIPSRTQPRQHAFIERAVRSIRSQTAASRFEIRIVVAVDRNRRLPEALCEAWGIRCVESTGESQAAALNAGIGSTDGDYVAFLEDDDQWMPDYLALAAEALGSAPFVSSTQAEHDDRGHLLRVNDFPTPSGWLMTRRTLDRVGPFDEAYRFHLDNEWLGRLNAAGTRRIHLVESTAPIDPALAREVRPWLAILIERTHGRCRLARHPHPVPLVRRLVHAASGMARIASEPGLKDRSMQEYQALADRYGTVPW